MHVVIPILTLVWDLGVRGVLDGAAGMLNVLQDLHPARCAMSYVGVGFNTHYPFAPEGVQ